MNWFVILAAGSGSRFSNKENKMFKCVQKDTPLFLSVIKTCKKIKGNNKIVLVYNRADKTKIKSFITKDIILIEGSNTSRQSSLSNAIKWIKNYASDNDVVITLDGDRPLVSQTILKKSITITKKFGYATAYIPLDDSIVFNNNKNFKYLERSSCYLIQTPQTFLFKFWKNTNKKGTDLFSCLNLPLKKNNLFLGNKLNLKITTKEDLDLIKK